MGDKEIYYEATGLSKVDDKVLSAAYKIYKFLKEYHAITDIEVVEATREEHDMEQIDLREGILIISNAETLIKTFGFQNSFTLREASQALGVSPTITNRWMEKALSLGVVETVNIEGEVRYRVSRERFVRLLEAIKNSMDEIKLELASQSTQQSPSLSREDIEERTQTQLDITNSFNSTVNEIQSLVEQLAERRGIDASLNHIQKVRELIDVIGGELAIEVVDCLRIGRLLSMGQINVSEDDLAKCNRILESLRSVQ